MAAKKVRDVMATNVRSLHRSDSLQVAKDIMTQGRIRHFPVLDGGKVVGVISQRDLFRASLSSVMMYGEKAEKAYLDTVSIKSVVNEPAVTISPEAPLQEAARVMIEKKIGCMPVVEGDKLVGIVTETDLLKALAEV